MSSRRRTRREVKKRERGFRERLKRFLVEYLINNDGITIAEVCKKLGRVKEGKTPKYNDVNTYITLFEEEGLIIKEKDKSVKRPGAKPTIIRLKNDLETLRKIWNEFPDLRPEILKSKFYKGLIQKLVEEEILSKIFGGPDIVRKIFKNEWAAGEFLRTMNFVYYALEHLPTFVNYVINGKLAKTVGNTNWDDWDKYFKEAARMFLSLKLSTPDEVNIHAGTVTICSILERILEVDALLSQDKKLYQVLRKKELLLKEYVTMMNLLRMLYEAGFISQIDFKLIIALWDYRHLRNFSGEFNYFKWIKHIPAERKEDILNKILSKRKQHSRVLPLIEPLRPLADPYHRV